MTPGSNPRVVHIAGRFPPEAAGDAAILCTIRVRLIP